MTDKHTPGPWEPKRIESQQWEIDAPNGDPLLGHWAWQGLAAVYGNDDNKVAGSQVAKANARLIASAPAMLAALRAMVGMTINSGHVSDDMAPALNMALAVIKEATGETE